MFDPADHRHMARALALAERGRYSADPNPRVGCVIVREGEVVGEGWHRRAGDDHAEIEALRSGGECVRGGTVYLTLEPCSHTGRTGPCAPELAKAGLSRVVIAMEDPNPQVGGEGRRILEKAGVRVESGLLVDEAAALKYLRDQARDFDGVLVGGRLSYDLDFTAEEGAVFTTPPVMSH